MYYYNIKRENTKTIFSEGEEVDQRSFLHWKNSIIEASTNPCSEFLSNIATILDLKPRSNLTGNAGDVDRTADETI